MSVRRLPVALLAVAGVAAVVALVAASGSAQRAHAQPAGGPLPTALQGSCPRLRAQALPGDAVPQAALAALNQARVLYRGLKLAGIRVTESILAPDDSSGRGGYARLNCGPQLQRRTVVVWMEFPAMRPSASLSEGVVLVSRFAGVYRVWALLH